MNGNNYLRNNYNPKKGLGAPRRKNGGKPYKFAHTTASQKGLGDYYGTGIRAPLGTMREGTGMETISSKKLSIKPRSLA